MAAILRLAASELKAAAGRRLRRLRRDRLISVCRQKKILLISLLTLAFIALLTTTSSLFPYSSNPSFEGKFDDLPTNFIFQSNSENQSTGIKSGEIKSGVGGPINFNSENQSGEIKSSEIKSGVGGPINFNSENQSTEIKSSEIKSGVGGPINFNSENQSREIKSSEIKSGVGGAINFNSENQSREIKSSEIKSGVSGQSVLTWKNSELPLKSLSPDEALIYAKKEIEEAPLVTDDPDLYAPLFLNVSVFKRSYELMERILKVYIYRDGQRPIFHTPELKGIYASEGWFMKLIEQNRHFVAKDPSRAHLFYLPYSARRMELALYVPDSHNMKPLSKFLRDYVNQISSKYPFWNRTKGSDHFLVACHDWGPYTTTLHAELRKNTIKALCNADASEGIFVRGKDVSLPETTIRIPRRPLRQVGGRPVSQRPILAFFAGNMHGRVRPTLLEHWGNTKDENMKIFGPLPNQIARKTSYIEHMKSSKFCICPMGYEVNSPRIVEAIYYECVPVIIADNFVLPLEEVLDWSAFSVVVAEKDIPRLKDILLGIPQRKYMKMQGCVKRLQRHFLWHGRPEKYDMFHMILHSIWFSRLNHVQPT